MSLKKITITRHGFRLNWLTQNWTSATGLARDPPLAAYGVNQAEELTQYFLSIEDRPTAIFSSPYYRCLQTAQPVSQALNIPIYVEHGLSEWYSPVVPGTGLHPRPTDAASLSKYFPEIDPSWSSTYYPSRKGEDVRQLHQRAEDFLRDFLPLVNDHAHILLVSHAATVIATVRALACDPQLPLRVGCCSISELSLEDSTWKPAKVADASHLSRGAEREWGLEDIEIANGKVVEDPGEPGTENEEDIPVGTQVKLHLSARI